MDGHFLISPASRDFTTAKVEKMTDARVHAFFARLRCASPV